MTASFSPLVNIVIVSIIMLLVWIALTDFLLLIRNEQRNSQQQPADQQPQHSHPYSHKEENGKWEIDEQTTEQQRPQ
jgi:hypothetical protein